MTDLGGMRVRILVGPTASGKERLARALATAYSLEIVSMDSMKVYRGMDIGTAKPPPGGPVHHMVDIAWPDQRFDLATWLKGAEEAVVGIRNRGGHALLSGGTGLYLKAFLSGVFDGPPANRAIRERLEADVEGRGPEFLHARLLTVDPVAAGRIGPRDAKRIVRALEVFEITGKPISEIQRQFDRPRSDMTPILVGLDRDREELYSRVDDRIDRMMAAGFLDEVSQLWRRPRPPGRSASQALGYRELKDHLDGRIPLDEAVRRIRSNTRVFVRRQMSWFRRFPDIRWLTVSGDSDTPGIVTAAAEAFSLVNTT